MDNIEYNFNIDGNLNKKNDNVKIPIPEDDYKETEIIKIKKKISKLYIILSVNVILYIVVFVIIILLKNTLFFMLWLFLGFPIFILSVIFFIIKLYRDRNKIKNVAIKLLAKNYITARFIYPNKRTVNINFLVNGNEIHYQGGIYLIDEKAIYFNEDREPIIDYIKGIPNPLLYNYIGLISTYMNILKERKDARGIKDFNGLDVDVSYSSETLQSFKKDKLFSEFHTSGKEDLLQLITLVLIFIVLVILIYFVFGSK